MAPSAETPSPYAPSRDPAVWCLAVGETVIWAGTMYLFPALLPRWETALGFGKAELTATYTAALVVSALLSPYAGRLVDRHHGRALLTGSALIAAALLVVLSTVQTLPVFVALWLCLGACMAGGLYDPCFAFIMRTRGTDARRTITLITLVAGFAGTLSFPLNTFIAEWSGWRASALCFAALVAFVAAPCFWFGTRRGAGRDDHSMPTQAPGAQPDASAVRGDPAFRRAFRTATFWLLATCFALVYLNHGTVLTHLLPMLAERGIALEYAVLTIAMIGPAQVAGRVAMIFAERWLSTAVITVASMASLSGAATCLMFAHATPWLLPAFAVLQGAGVGISSITRPAIISDLLGRQSFGAIAGAIALPVMMAMAFAPSTGAAFWSLGGYDLVFGANVAMALSAVVLMTVAIRIGPAPWAED